MENLKVKRIFFVCSWWMFLLSCGPSDQKYQDQLKDAEGITRMTSDHIDQEVENLSSIAQQIAFLEEINDKDQEVRKKEKEIVQQYGHNSPEHLKVYREWQETDEVNIVRIEAYLSRFGYPSLSTHGKKAAYTPWLVLHHAPDNAVRFNNFKYIYDGYQKGSIDGGEFTFFLGRMYQIEKGERITFEGPFNYKMEIDTIMKSLDLYKFTVE